MTHTAALERRIEDLEAQIGALDNVLNMYDESCEDIKCECCATWRLHVRTAIDLLRVNGGSAPNPTEATAQNAPSSSLSNSGDAEL